jgi:hypothetical protein
LRTVDHCRPERLAAIVPATPDDSTCVVETGRPYMSAAAMVDIATSSAEALSAEERQLRDELADLPEVTILQLIYQQKAYEGAKDYEFSGTSMREHWQSGYEDTRRTLKHKRWLAMPSDGAGLVVHDVHREQD